jgi:hypothetical protein
MTNSKRLTKQERDATQRSLLDPTTRAAMIVQAALLDLPTVDQRRAVLSFALSTVATDGGARPADRVATLRSLDAAALPRPTAADTGE